MSMGWMTQVTSIPKAPPLKKDLIIFDTGGRHCRLQLLLLPEIGEAS
jgi:hypothetical protein